MNIPNTITISRIVLIPVFIAVFYLPYEWAPALATFVFWFAAITDWFDGYLARKLQQQSALGAFIDPLADKLMVITALLLILSGLMTICSISVIRLLRILRRSASATSTSSAFCETLSCTVPRNATCWVSTAASTTSTAGPAPTSDGSATTPMPPPPSQGRRSLRLVSRSSHRRQAPGAQGRHRRHGRR